MMQVLTDHPRIPGKKHEERADFQVEREQSCGLQKSLAVSYQKVGHVFMTQVQALAKRYARFVEQALNKY